MPRIRGAIYDGLRQLDWVPRSVRSRARQVEKAFAELEHREGRAPSDEELADHLGITEKELTKWLSAIASTTIGPLDRAIAAGAEPSAPDTAMSGSPSAVIEDKELSAIMRAEIRKLPEREKLVLSLYYDEGLTLSEIGDVIGVTESRVSQIHTKSVSAPALADERRRRRLTRPIDAARVQPASPIVRRTHVSTRLVAAHPRASSLVLVRPRCRRGAPCWVPPVDRRRDRPVPRTELSVLRRQPGYRVPGRVGAPWSGRWIRASCRGPARSPGRPTWSCGTATAGGSRTVGWRPRRCASATPSSPARRWVERAVRSTSGSASGSDYVDPAPFLGERRGRPRLVPVDGRAARPAPPARWRCGV